MKWTLAARDSDGDYRQWCGHWHANADEANECGWSPEDPDWQIFIVEEHHFDPILECVHELHPAECLRCLALECIHLNNPEECERCYVSQLENADTTASPETQGEPPGPEEPDRSGGTGDNTNQTNDGV